MGEYLHKTTRKFNRQICINILTLTFFRLIISIFAVIAVVVDDGLVVVGLLLPVQLVVLVAEEVLVPQREGVPGLQLPLAGHAPKAFRVEYPVLGAHHIVVFPEGTATLFALGAEEPDKVFLAVRFPVTYKASTRFIKEHLTLVALKSCNHMTKLISFINGVKCKKEN